MSPSRMKSGTNGKKVKRDTMKKGTGTWYTERGTSTEPSEVDGMEWISRAGKRIALVPKVTAAENEEEAQVTVTTEIEIALDDEHPFEIVLPGMNRVEADTLDGALCAAATILDEATLGGVSRKIAQAEVIITRDGRYDAAATNLARAGNRRAPSEERVS